MKEGMEQEKEIMTIARMHRVHGLSELALDLARGFGFRKALGALKNLKTANDGLIAWIEEEFKGGD